MLKKSFVIINEFGLHARPAANFVRCLSSIPAHITIECEGQTTDAKSIMGVVALRIIKDQVITIEIQSNEQSHIDTVETYLTENQIATPL